MAFKKRDRLDPKNWRAITLLNADCKIAYRTIAARLLKVIHLIVNRDQTCGVLGRFNVAFLRDVVEFLYFLWCSGCLAFLGSGKGT